MSKPTRKFAFIINPSDKADVARKYPFAKYLPHCAVAGIIRRMQPKVVSHITGIKALGGTKTEGWLIALPRFPEQLAVLDIRRLDKVYQELFDCCVMAQDLGAEVIGLGGFTAIVGDKGLTLVRLLEEKGINLSVTTGNAYTAYLAVEGALKAAEMIGINIEESTVSIIGATGSVGSVSAELLAWKNIKTLKLIGRDAKRVGQLAFDIGRRRGRDGPYIEYGTDIWLAVTSSQIVLTVSSAMHGLIETSWPNPGTVFCDVARPRNVSSALAEREDILVIDGAIVKVPGEKVDFGFNFGLLRGHTFGCMAETIAMTLAGIKEHHVGPYLGVDWARQIAELAEKQGFVLAGLRCFDKEIPMKRIEAAARCR